MRNKTGIVIGKFCPLHAGHLYFIRKAFEYCDKLLILISHDERFMLSIPKEIRHYLDIESRYRDVVNAINSESHFLQKCFIISIVNETKIPQYPNGWKEFTELCKIELNKYFHKIEPDFIFSSEPSYDEHYKIYFPNTEHIIIESDRQTYPISGSELREKMLQIEKIKKELKNMLSSHTYQRVYNTEEIK